MLLQIHLQWQSFLRIQLGGKKEIFKLRLLARVNPLSQALPLVLKITKASHMGAAVSTVLVTFGVASGPQNRLSKLARVASSVNRDIMNSSLFYMTVAQPNDEVGDVLLAHSNVCNLLENPDREVMSAL
mmetsp:Transcript_32593/g.42003  ORF Transcript_32593/g.42003 Transcript_32593/m.42003 type:complete len:129 (+) Transcript_32593:733-1119(+)